MNITLGAEPTAGEKASSLFSLWKISMTPNSPVGAELMKDSKIAGIIKAMRLGTGSFVGIVFLIAVLKKRKKTRKKKAALVQAPRAPLNYKPTQVIT